MAHGDDWRIASQPLAVLKMDLTWHWAREGLWDELQGSTCAQKERALREQVGRMRKL